MSALPSHLELVQGIVLPKPVGADPVLDFLNTRAGWVGRGPARVEWLTNYEALALWTGYVGLLPDATVGRLVTEASTQPVEAARRLAAAVEFRADLYDVLTDSTATASFEAVARVTQKASARRRLIAVPTDSPGLEASWELPEDLSLPLDHLALLAADLLTGDDRPHIRLCPGDSCGWLFLDPRGRRRWCSMSTCGNRAKVRAHAARTR
ncbi:putative stress-induced transcription regulator [Kribbella sp. VKM Ac-2527]|uniref:Putative stress-induced transcription regulator n=1 Tax=Kribbella caucasensis TaxID=2512215 RepID=A0A4R6KF22_9ACTN|nr:CGNR zinc finger domain-containing protein [Kribbella sp. VKM Ac-2527]TDO49058.1 putative stress-induced transcription regulator [Kribbella sp. VKM Ac-2527]